MTTYTTKDGDTIDGIAWRWYGPGKARTTEQILEANPGLADYGPMLPRGLQINLPVIESSVRKQGVRLWD